MVNESGNPLIGAIAQLGERGLCKPEVEGSSPSSSTTQTIGVSVKTTTVNFSISLNCQDDIEMTEEEVKKHVEQITEKVIAELVQDEKLQPYDHDHYVSVDQREF